MTIKDLRKIMIGKDFFEVYTSTINSDGDSDFITICKGNGYGMPHTIDGLVISYITCFDNLIGIRVDEEEVIVCETP